METAIESVIQEAAAHFRKELNNFGAGKGSTRRCVYQITSRLLSRINIYLLKAFEYTRFFNQGEKMNSKRKKFVRFIIVSLLLLTSMFAGHSITAQAKPKIDAQDFHDQMRKLWEDHITWTRMVIVGTLADPDAFLPDLGASTNRLLQNQADIGNAIKPFYGDTAGNQLTELLRQHIIVAAQILQAAKSGQPLDELIASWYANANEIAEFLNAANPENWPLEEMRAMMREHLDLTLQEAVDYLHGDYPASAAGYDLVHNQALDMADMLSDGIIKQFHQKFK
jgi:hypothetical protein